MTRATLIALSLFIAALATVAMVRQAWPHTPYCCGGHPKADTRQSPDHGYHLCVIAAPWPGKWRPNPGV